jgi:hypothetical protein
MHELLRVHFSLRRSDICFHLFVYVMLPPCSSGMSPFFFTPYLTFRTVWDVKEVNHYFPSCKTVKSKLHKRIVWVSVYRDTVTNQLAYTFWKYSALHKGRDGVKDRTQ